MDEYDSYPVVCQCSASNWSTDSVLTCDVDISYKGGCMLNDRLTHAKWLGMLDCQPTEDVLRDMLDDQ